MHINEPAFPIPGEKDGEYMANRSYGLSKREWIATRVSYEEIKELIPDTVGDCEEFLGLKPGTWMPPLHYPRMVAIIRIHYANALIDELKKPFPPVAADADTDNTIQTKSAPALSGDGGN